MLLVGHCSNPHAYPRCVPRQGEECTFARYSTRSLHAHFTLLLYARSRYLHAPATYTLVLSTRSRYLHALAIYTPPERSHATYTPLFPLGAHVSPFASHP